MRGAIPPFSQYVFMAWCLVNSRDFTFYFYTYKTATYFEHKQHSADKYYNKKFHLRKSVHQDGVIAGVLADKR
jgi:hypothetical protein